MLTVVTEMTHGVGRDSELYPSMLSSQTEALARCDFLLRRRYPFGLIVGPSGTGKTVLLREVARERSRRGSPPSISVDMTGIGGKELISALCAQLDIQIVDSSLQTRLQGVRDRLEGVSACGEGQLILLDHLGVAASDAFPMISQLLRISAVSRSLTILAAVRNADVPEIAALQADFGWLRIDLPRLTAGETIEAAQSLMKRGGLHAQSLSSKAAHALHRITQGVPRELHRVTELMTLATQVDDIECVTLETLQDVALESVGRPGREV